MFVIRRPLALIPFLLLTVCARLPGADAPAPAAAPPVGKAPPAPSQMDISKWTPGRDGKLHAPLKERETPRSALPDLKPADAIVTVNGEALSWGALRAHLDLLISNIRLPQGVTAEDVEAERDNLVMGRLPGVARNYVYKNLLAQEARRRGLALTAEEVAAKRGEIVDKLKKSRRDAARHLEVFDAPGSFFMADVTNSLLLAKLESQILRPAVKITDADLQAAFEERAEQNRGLTATNLTLRPKLEALRKKIVAGEESCSNAAYLESECGSSGEYGEFGTKKCEDLLPELVKALTNLNTNEISNVVETPYSFHLLKLNKLNRGFLKEGEKGPAPVVSINFAHIMFEKKELLPEMSAEELTKELGKEALRKKRDELLDGLIAKAKIESAVELGIKPGQKRKPARSRRAPGPWR